MENMIYSEFSKYEEKLKDSFREKYNLPDKELDEIVKDLRTIVMQMIQLMRDGKSVHEKFFSDIILNSVDAIIGFDCDFKIFLWNKGAESIFGYSKNEVMGKEFSFLIPQYLLDKGEKDFLVKEVEEKGFITNYESERLTKDGQLINVSITRFLIFNEIKEKIGSVGMIRDITTIKKLQKELREKENLALIGEVVSSIAHSLSNPLNIISGNADYLLMNKKENDKDHEELKCILDEAVRITKSIKHLLNFSRPLNITREKTNINRIIEKAVTDVKFLIQDKNITIRKSLHNNIPDISIDRGQIEETICNLLTNSVQAIKKTGEIIIKTETSDNNIIIEISDSGEGISKVNLEKIFTPFFSSKEYGKGTGLGLSIARRIITEHGGSISASSKPGKGAKFLIKLPLN
ncbi:MAG: PAS domain S-box protein [Ignavibacteria bacterium]|nr:PAS domain S-box protein [Ignavibacteria bacterium]